MPEPEKPELEAAYRWRDRWKRNDGVWGPWTDWHVVGPPYRKDLLADTYDGDREVEVDFLWPQALLAQRDEQIAKLESRLARWREVVQKALPLAEIIDLSGKLKQIHEVGRQDEFVFAAAEMCVEVDRLSAEERAELKEGS